MIAPQSFVGILTRQSANGGQTERALLVPATPTQR
jgi:hypothetical protein